MAVRNSYHTLEEIRQRKDELTQELNGDSEKMGKLWNKVFVKREDTTKGEFVSSMISNGVMAVDAFLLFRKLKKNYNALFGSRKKSKKR